MNNEFKELSKKILERDSVAILNLVHVETMKCSWELQNMLLQMEYEGFNKLVPSVSEEEYACKNGLELAHILLEEEVTGFIALVDISYPENVKFNDDWSLHSYDWGMESALEYIYGDTIESLFKSVIELSDKLLDRQINKCRRAQQALNV